MLFKPSQSDILLSQHNNHRDGNFSIFLENCIICPSLGCQNILEIPVLGCELVLGTTSGETGAVLRDCTCAPHVPASQPQHHPQQIFTGRKERESTCGQVVRTKTCPSNQGARRSTWHVPAMPSHLYARFLRADPTLQRTWCKGANYNKGCDCS